jgi:bacteriocin-like protein
MNDTKLDHRELTEDELNHISGGTPKAAPTFPTEQIAMTYSAIEWTYTK